MGTIQVPGRLSGRTYTVNIKGDTPSATEQARIRAFVDEREAQFAQTYEQRLGKPLAEPDDGTAIGRGWEAGKAGAYSRLGTATEYLGRGLGLESLVNTGREMRKEGDYESFLESMRQPKPTTLEDVKAAEGFFPTIGAGLTYLGEGIGQSGPEMLAPLAATGAGTLVGGPLVGLGAGAVTAFPSFFGGNVQRQEAEVAAGRKAEVDVSDAIVGAVGQSALNAIGDKLLLGGFLKPGQKWLTRTAVGAGEGAAIEIPTEIAQQIIERKQAGLALDSDEAIAEYVNAGILGGVMGGGIRAGTAGLGIGIERPPAAPGTTPPATPTLGLPTPPKPGVAKVQSVTRQGPRFGTADTTVVRLDDGATLILEGDATEADIARAVDEHNQTKAAAETQAAPKAPKPTTRVEDIPEAETIPDSAYEAAMDQRLGAGVSVDQDLADARGVYDERLALAEEGGADPEEAKRVAARAAVNYVDSLQEGTRKRLERFRSTMARVAAGSTRGVMPPDLPDSAYASEFGEAVQKDLFSAPPAAPPAAPEAAPEAAPRSEVAQVMSGLVGGFSEKARGSVAFKVSRNDPSTQNITNQKILNNIRKDPFYNLVENPDGSASIIGVRVNEESDWVGVAPNTREDAAPTTAPIPTTQGEAAPKVKTPVDDSIFDEAWAARMAEAQAKPSEPTAEARPAAPKGVDVSGVDEAISQGVGNINVVEDGQPVPFEKFAVSVDGNKAEVGFVERAKGARKGIGYDAYIALGEKLAQRGVKLQSSQTKLGPGQSLWKKLEQNGYAKLNPQTKRLEFVTQAERDAAPTTEVQDDTTAAAPEPVEMGVGVEGGEQSLGAGGQRADIVPSAEGAAAPEIGGLGGGVSLPVGTDATEGAEPGALSEVEDEPIIEPVVDPIFLTYRRGITSRAVPPSEAPKAVADVVAKERVTQRLTQFFQQRATPALLRYTTAQGGINNPTTWKDFPDWMPLADQSKVVQLLGRLNRKEREKYKFPASEVEPLGPDAEAAHTYFSKTLRPVDAVDLMLDDLTADYEIYEGSLRPGRTEIEHRDLMMGTGSEVAKRALNWVRANLSPKTNAEIDLLLKKEADVIAVQEAWLSDIDRVEQGRAERKEARKVRAEQAVESGYDAGSIVRRMAAADSRVALDQEMHYSVRAALNVGDLKGALRALVDTTSNAELKALANRFAELVGTTRVRILYPGDSAKYIGRDRGIYVQAKAGVDPEYENTILINGQIGMTNHVLMHEMAHAVSANFIDANPNHPIVKQLQALLDELRAVGPKQGLYSTGRGTTKVAYPTDFYGLTNVSEMVAEGYGRLALGETDNGLRDLMKRTRLREPVDKQVEFENPLTAWERFKELIGNILNVVMRKPLTRRPRTKRTETIQIYETAADRFHRLVDGLLSEAPQVLPDSVLQAAVVNPMVARNVLNNAVKNAPIWNSAGRTRLRTLLSSSTPQPLRRALLGLLQLDWFNDLAGSYFPQIAKLKTIDDQRRGKINTLNANVKPVLEDLLTYARKSPELYATLVGIQGQATLAEVDPTRPVSDYSADRDKVRVWHDLNRQLGTGEMRTLFKKTRNILRAYRAEVERVLKSRVKDITDDTAKQNQLFNQLMQKLDEENAIDPYFSLMRQGDYWLEYTAEDTTAEPVAIDPLGRPQRPTARFVQAFESPFALAQFRAQLEAKTDDQGKPVAWDFEENRRPISDMNREGYVPPSFVQGALNIISAFDSPTASAEERSKIEDARDAIHSMFLRLTPDHSLLKSFIKRKGTRGFIGDITPLGVIDAPVDMVQALANKTAALSYQLANIEYGGKIQRLINDAAETRNKLVKSSGLTLADKSAVDAYHDEFVDRAKFAKTPQVTGSAQLARGITFNMTLGFSIAGAANNLMQIPMIGATELGGRYGMGATMRELGFAMRALRNAGKVQKVLSYGPDGRELRQLDNVDNFGSIANYFEPDEKGKLQLRTDMKIPAKLRDKLANLDVLAEVLANNGMLNASMSQEMLEAESGWLHKINRWGGFLMHHAERFNRQSMAIAAYNLELSKIKGQATQQAKLAAAKKAVEIAERVNGTIGASTAPRFAQGAVGSVLFMFKRFGLHMARYIIGTANQALRGATPEDRAVARYQIIGMLGTTALFAGVQGLPFFSELMTIFNAFFTDDDEERPEVIVQKFLGEPYYHGALNYLLGIEVASRISMSGLIFRENKIEKDQSVLYDLFEMFGGPAVGVFMNTERGIDLLSQGELYRGVETMMPSVVKSILKSYRFSTEGATTLRGDEVIPLTPADVIKQAIGYTPVDYARQQERVSGAKRIDEAIRNKKRKLLRKYNLALADGDFAEARDVLMEMREFTRQHPEDAITSDTINRSYQSFRQRSQEMISGVSFTGTGRGRAQQYIDEFDQDTTFWGE